MVFETDQKKSKGSTLKTIVIVIVVAIIASNVVAGLVSFLFSRGD